MEDLKAPKLLSMGIQTAERVSHQDQSDNYVFQRSILAYKEAAKIVSGKVLEIGTGSGYGVDVISPEAEKFTTIDKFECGLDLSEYENVEFKQMNVPPFTGLEDNSFDFVITFQVIEHIQKDKDFVSEIYRVLKPGGKLIVTTPNIKTSITRNPWHIREYTIQQLKSLLESVSFKNVQDLGVFGNEKVMAYYEENKKSVQKITRWDIFNLQYRLPRWMLQIPYDILNRRNRKKLLAENTDLTTNIQMEDYSIAKAKDQCFDLFYIAEK